jgi:hypothetical protein
MVVADLLRRRSTGARVGALLAVVVIAVPMTQVRAVDGTPIPTGAAIPSVYHWLAEHGDGGTLVELPIGPHLGRRMNLEAARAMYFSTRHWLPLVNGYTSYKPPAYALFEAYAAQLPSAEALQALVDCAGLRWVLVHARHHARRFDDVPGLRRVGAFSTEGGLPDVLYAVTLTSPGHLCAGGLPAPGRTLAGNPTSRERELEGVVEVRGVPPTVRPRTPFQASIVLTNRGDRLWAGTALDEETRVRIEVRWLDESDQAVDATQSIALPGDAAPGRSVAFEAWIDAPSRLGRHRLQVLLRRGEGTGPAALTWQTPVVVGG